MASIGDPIQHGTYKAYRQHLRRSETPCARCRKANSDYEQDRRLAGPKSPRQLKPCGTRAAWTRHKKHGEQPCDACRRAASEASTESRRRRRGVGKPSAPVPALPGEAWLPIPGASGYEVSDLGRVKSIDRFVERRTGGYRRFCPGQLLQSFALPGRNGNYQHVRINGQIRPVHQLVLEAFVGLRPEGTETLHGNDISDDNRLENLRWGTRSENVQDSIRNGRHYVGARTHCPRRHALAAPNLCRFAVARGHRSCLACHRANAAVRRALRKDIHLDMQSVSDDYYSRIMNDGAAA